MTTNPGPPPQRPTHEMIDMANRLEAEGLIEVAKAVRDKVQTNDDLYEPLPMPQACGMDGGCDVCQ